MTLIIAVYDFDRIGSDELLGVALVSLAPPGSATGSEDVPSQYTIDIDQPLLYGNVSQGFGHIRGRLSVSHGKEQLEEALEAAARDACGVQAKKLTAIEKVLRAPACALM